MEMYTDVMFLIALEMDLPTILNFCSASKRSYNICKDPSFWGKKLDKDYSEYKENFNDKNPREKYTLIYKLLKLKKELFLSEDIVTLYNEGELYLFKKKIKNIPKEISALTNLGHLLINLKIESIPKELSKLPELQILYVHKNVFVPKEVKNLPDLKIYYL